MKVVDTLGHDQDVYLAEFRWVLADTMVLDAMGGPGLVRHRAGAVFPCMRSPLGQVRRAPLARSMDDLRPSPASRARMMTSVRSTAWSFTKMDDT